MKIGNIDINEKVFIIAEIGNNHEGDFELAKKMISLAAETGVDAVKFQTFKTEHYVSSVDTDRYQRLQSFELSENEFFRLKKVADEAGVLFLSTPFDLISADFLNEIVPAFKIASGDNTFYPLLEKVASFAKPVIMSTGLADWSQVAYAKSLIERIWSDKCVVSDIALLHCVTAYPVPFEESNLAIIRRISEKFECIVGYSDHTLGCDAAVYSVAAGARIVEKHFTVDKNYSDFRDHQLSADYNEMKAIVDRIRVLEVLLGSDDAKLIQNSEHKNSVAVRRSIAAARDIETGEIIDSEAITWVRPGSGIKPGMEYEILGHRANGVIKKGELISPELISKQA